MRQTFKTGAIERLRVFLANKSIYGGIKRLTPDASTREFFRIEWNLTNSIACVYPEVFDNTLPQIDVTKLFLKCNLPVARIFEVDHEHGIIIHEDFGDKILHGALQTSGDETRDKLINRSITLIAEIQRSTPMAFVLNSIAARLKFDEQKLLWELNFFKKHYYSSLKKKALPLREDKRLTKEFTDLAKELEGYAKVLTHRDFHPSNLMIDQRGELAIIDHQDARIGSTSYDLVSLLLDRITEVPAQQWLNEKKGFLLSERERLGLEKIEAGNFDNEFDLVSVQRCLKAIGTFSNQAANFKNDQYADFIDPMFRVALAACERLQRFPFLQSTIRINLSNQS